LKVSLIYKYIILHLIELLQKNPDKRMSIKEVIEHPWLDNKLGKPPMAEKNNH